MRETSLMHTKETLLAYLAEQEIQTNTIDHPAVFTVEEARQHTAHLPGAHVKNLFLVAKDGSRWLVTARDDQLIKVNGLSRLLGAPRYSFGKPDVLQVVLGVSPGSVTPLALINDTDRQVNFVLDHKLIAYEKINVHPLVNTSTTTISADDLLKFAAGLCYRPIITDLEESLQA